jgi:hypothetical protein
MSTQHTDFVFAPAAYAFVYGAAALLLLAAVLLWRRLHRR